MSPTVECAFLDIGHGDSAVLTFPHAGGQACIVVDGGATIEAAESLATYLVHKQCQRIDLLVATHPHGDHIVGLIQLFEKEFRNWNGGEEKCVQTYWGTLSDADVTDVAYIPGDTDSATLTAREYVMQSLVQNQRLTTIVHNGIMDEDEIRYPSLEDVPDQPFPDAVQIDLLWPDVQVPDSQIKFKAEQLPEISSAVVPANLAELKDAVEAQAEEAAAAASRKANNASIVLRVTPKLTSGAMSKWSFLLSGDAEPEAWEGMREAPGVKSAMKAKVLKLPHHGSVNGIDKASFEVIKASHCVNSSGQSHGLPDGPILNLVRDVHDRNLFCTERNNSPLKPGPCGGKDQCPRHREEVFRSIRFAVDLDTGQCEIKAFQIDTNSGVAHDIENDIIWCPETGWAAE